MARAPFEKHIALGRPVRAAPPPTGSTMRTLKVSATIAVILLAACGDDPVGGSVDLGLRADTTYIAPRQTLQLTAGDAGSATYRSLDEAVATVSGSGLVTGVSVGAARIVGKKGRAEDTITINVTPAPETALATGSAHACVLNVAGRAYCWGENSNGQLGNGATASSATPVAVAGNLTFAMVEAGDSTTCGVTPSGEGYCWGAGSRWQLGNGTNQRSAVPVKVASTRPLASVSVGFEGGCALTPDGTALCWGQNRNGQAGTGDKVVVATPALVSTGLKFSEISSALFHTCALATDGTAHCWGSNALFALGTDGYVDTAERPRPTAVVGGLRYSSLSAGAMNTCAVTVGKDAYCWGSNILGSLGVGRLGLQSPEGSVPTRVVDGAGFVRVSAGEENSIFTPNCLLDAAGRAYCMGANTVGQLGTTTAETCRRSSTSSVACSTRPIPVSGGLAFETVDPGLEFACGLTRDGRVFCWGSNRSGQIGGTAGAETSTPTRAAEQLILP